MHGTIAAAMLTPALHTTDQKAYVEGLLHSKVIFAEKFPMVQCNYFTTLALSSVSQFRQLDLTRAQLIDQL